MRTAAFPLVLGICVGLIVYVLFALVPTAGFAAELLRAGAYPLVLSLIGATLMSGASLPTIILAGLVGINAGLILFYIRQRRAAPSSSIAGGIAGGIAAMFGIGCAACGSTLAIALFGASSGAFVSALPYQGAWLGDTGLILLAISAAFLVREIRKPLVCAV